MGQSIMRRPCSNLRESPAFSRKNERGPRRHLGNLPDSRGPSGSLQPVCSTQVALGRLTGVDRDHSLIGIVFGILFNDLMQMTGIGSQAQRGRREFLFLQGNSSPFMERLARGVMRGGHGVHRVAFSAGDCLFWAMPGAIRFQASFRRWSEFFRTLVERRRITDLVLFGDSRPYHRIAIAVARRRGIAVHVLEEGYLRPDWITLEPDGSNAQSSFPRNPAEIQVLAAGLPQQPQEQVSGGFGARAIWDIAHHVVAVGAGWLFPNYLRHRPYHPIREAYGWTHRVLCRHTIHRREVEKITPWLAADGRVFLFPLQLDADYQVRRHFSGRSVAEAIRQVVTSFARCARPEDRLLIKVHPLDNGLSDWRRLIASLALTLDLGDRVRVLDGGNLATLIHRSTGVIVVNSTTGITALHHRRPVIALGRAIYDIPGLTHQGALDTFWAEPTIPDAALFADFYALLMWRTQVNGSFFTRRGIEVGTKGVLLRLGVHPLPLRRSSTTATYAGAPVEQD